MSQLRDAAVGVRAEDLTRFLPPDGGGGRASAVLILLGESTAGPDLLLIRRSDTVREHAGFPAFPGGSLDEQDDGAVAAALREAAEETGLDPSGVSVQAQLPELFLASGGFVVTPVLAWWAQPSPVRVVDPGEVASVHRVGVGTLADPAHRFQVRHPSGFVGPAFAVDGLLVWGFTAGLVDRVLALGGWERPWDRGDCRDLDQADPRRGGNRGGR